MCASNTETPDAIASLIYFLDRVTIFVHVAKQYPNVVLSVGVVFTQRRRYPSWIQTIEFRIQWQVDLVQEPDAKPRWRNLHKNAYATRARKNSPAVNNNIKYTIRATKMNREFLACTRVDRADTRKKRNDTRRGVQRKEKISAVETEEETFMCDHVPRGGRVNSSRSSIKTHFSEERIVARESAANVEATESESNIEPDGTDCSRSRTRTSVRAICPLLRPALRYVRSSTRARTCSWVCTFFRPSFTLVVWVSYSSLLLFHRAGCINCRVW